MVLSILLLIITLAKWYLHTNLSSHFHFKVITVLPLVQVKSQRVTDGCSIQAIMPVLAYQKIFYVKKVIANWNHTFKVCDNRHWVM